MFSVTRVFIMLTYVSLSVMLPSCMFLAVVFGSCFLFRFLCCQPILDYLPSLWLPEFCDCLINFVCHSSVTVSICLHVFLGLFCSSCDLLKGPVFSSTLLSLLCDRLDLKHCVMAEWYHWGIRMLEQKGYVCSNLENDGKCQGLNCIPLGGNILSITCVSPHC